MSFRTLLRFSSLGLAVLFLMSFGCSPRLSESGSLRPPRLELPADTGLYLEVSAGGPVGALGPGAEARIWIRDDGFLRAEIQLEDEPWPRRVVAGPGFALLFDRRAGRMIPLSDQPGRIDIEGGSLAPEDLFWILLGQIGPVGSAGPLEWDGSVWRGVEGNVARRGWALDERSSLARAELAWRSESGPIHRLDAEFEGESLNAGGLRLPERSFLDGELLGARVGLSWTAQLVPRPADELFDPLREPPDVP